MAGPISCNGTAAAAREQVDAVVASQSHRYRPDSARARRVPGGCGAGGRYLDAGTERGADAPGPAGAPVCDAGANIPASTSTSS
jgi:hypothetical protein